MQRRTWTRQCAACESSCGVSWAMWDFGTWLLLSAPSAWPVILLVVATFSATPTGVVTDKCFRTMTDGGAVFDSSRIELVLFDVCLRRIRFFGLVAWVHEPVFAAQSVAVLGWVGKLPDCESSLPILLRPVTPHRGRVSCTTGRSDAFSSNT